MPNIDLKFYLAVFLRRLPYFLVIAALVSAIGITLAAILPPTFRSSASILVEPQQIPGELVQATAAVNPYEQAQIIEQRIMTRTNLLELADRIGLYADQPELSADGIAGDMRGRIEFIGFEPDLTARLDVPGATIIGVAFEAPDAAFAVKGANELVNLVLEENVRLRTDRAGDTSEFFQAEVDRLAAEIERQSARIAEMKTANVNALPDSLAARRTQQQVEQERLLALEREEAALRNQRATVVWVFERTGRSATLGALNAEEEELADLQSQLRQQRTIYAATSPQVRLLETRIAALEELVAEQREARAVPDAEGNPTAPATELEVELAPIDARLEYIAQEKALIAQTLAELDASIQSTPGNEMTLTGLERELANLTTEYEAAVANLGQAAIGERIEVMSKGERFSLIEPPTEPGGPDSPNRMLIASAGVAGGVGLGLGFVVLLELLNRSIRRPVEIANRLGAQPLATIPYIRTRGEKRWKRSVITMTLLGIVVAIPLGLLAVHTLYQPLDSLLMGLEEQPPAQAR
jgi:polysaccharide biosynthesis transport protein